MKIIEADIKHAGIMGNIHSKAWLQTYNDLFPAEYLNQESAKKREEEFLNSQKPNIHYYFVMENGNHIGMFKIVIEDGMCELSSIYLLKEYCGRGYGTACMNYIKSKYSMYTIVLWTLEANKEARKFYERNKFCDTGKRRTIYRGQNYIQIQYVYHLTKI